MASDSYKNVSGNNYSINLQIVFDVINGHPGTLNPTEMLGIYNSEKPIFSVISELQRRVLLERHSETKKMMVKNIWENKLNKQYLQDNYTNYTIVRDVYMPKSNEIEKNGYLNFLFKKMFNHKQFFILQMHSTTLTLVQLAVWAGFKTIKIYGLEGKGSHFFHKTENLNNKDLVNTIRNNIPAVDDNHIHIPGYRARKLIRPMAHYLKKKYNITLTLID